MTSLIINNLAFASHRELTFRVSVSYSIRQSCSAAIRFSIFDNTSIMLSHTFVYLKWPPIFFCTNSNKIKSRANRIVPPYGVVVKYLFFAQYLDKFNLSIQMDLMIVASKDSKLPNLGEMPQRKGVRSWGALKERFSELKCRPGWSQLEQSCSFSTLSFIFFP